MAEEIFEGESLLFFIRALAIWRMSARLELRSLGPELSVQTEDPDIAEPVISVPLSSHVPVLISDRVDSGFSLIVGDIIWLLGFAVDNLLQEL